MKGSDIMGYISEIRKYVGHMPVMHPCASVICEDDMGRILLQKRADDGTWCDCGGAMELFERAEDAAARELFEEAGLTAHELELFGVFSGEEQHHIYPNGDEVSTVDIVYICRKWSGEPKCRDGEATELKFFDIEDIPENLCRPFKAVIKKYIEYRHRDAMF